MPTDCISFRDTNYFSSLICDYLDENELIKPLYNRFPKLDNFAAQVNEKSLSFSKQSRAVLVNSLKEQYSDYDVSDLTNLNLDSLEKENTFTITTGHQLNLFTGPLYFLYKIISVINLTKELKDKYPKNNFVPVYWMATEDHDFDEIDYFNFKGKKVQWTKESSGAVGHLNTEGLDKVLEVFSTDLGIGENANYIKRIFENAYLKHENLASATRFLANELFGAYGLVIIDADDNKLKSLFAPYVKKELLEHISHKNVTESNDKINSLGFKVQVNPREINLFYLKDGLRERIVFENNVYKVNDTSISWTKSEILKHLDEAPERFSPNVIMRPLYQEVILPNLCYIGGGGELAYWLQLKSFFKSVEIPFPMLLLRNSVLIKTPKQSEKLDKLELSISELFKTQETLVNEQVKKNSKIDIDFTSQREHLQNQFKAMYQLAEQTDKSFIGAVAAQEKKQIKGLNTLEKRLLRAQKRKLNELISRITEIQNQLFPGQSLQERNMNFSELYLEFGDRLIQQLMLNLLPLKGDFLILEL